MSINDAFRLTALVREKRAELVALVLTLEEMQGMTTAEIRAYLGLPLSPCDVGYAERTLYPPHQEGPPHAGG